MLNNLGVAVGFEVLGLFQFLVEKYDRAIELLLVGTFIASIGFFWLVICAIIAV